MADSELADLTEDTAPALTDWLYKVNAAGTVDRKVSGSTLAGLVVPSLWLPARDFGATFGTPSLSVWNSRMEVWLFDAASQEIIGTSTVLPSFWTTFAVDLLWANAGAGSGNVMWQFAYGFLTAGEDASSAGQYTASSTSTIAAGANNIIVASSQIGAADVTNAAGQMLNLRIIRVAGDAADTLGNDCGLLGVTLRRVT